MTAEPMEILAGGPSLACATGKRERAYTDGIIRPVRRARPLDSSLRAGFGGGYRLGRLDGRAGIWMPGSVGSGDALRTLWGLWVGYDFTAL